jgi:hypothetical protein
MNRRIAHEIAVNRPGGSMVSRTNLSSAIIGSLKSQRLLRERCSGTVASRECNPQANQA